MKNGQRHVPSEYDTIQAAINAAVDGDEVIIHPGTYTGQGNYYINFGGKAITVRSIDPENPAIVAATIIDSNYLSSGFVFSNEEDANSILSGLTIEKARPPFAGTFPGGSPAGIFCYGASPTIRNCMIRESRSVGIYLIRSNVIIENCIISNNYRSGLLCSASSPTVINSIFVGNGMAFGPFSLPVSLGGGILFRGGELSVINCTFSGNVADVGGGICVYGKQGADISDIAIKNSIFWDNNANKGSEIAIAYHEEGTPPTVAVSYSNVQGGQSAVHVDPCSTLNWGDGNIDIDPCFADPGYWHPNDTPLDANDDFWVNGDYHLKSQAGRWEPSIYIGLDPTGDGFLNLTDFAVLANSWQKQGPFLPADLDHNSIVNLSDLKLLLDNYLVNYAAGEWVFDDVNSPCIDAGNPNSDWTAELWPHGKRINMGAYGGTSQASMSTSQEGNIADLNKDGLVDLLDFSYFSDNWQSRQVLLLADLDLNGRVTFDDLMIFCENWLWEE